MNKNVMIGLGVVVILIVGYFLMNNNVQAPETAEDAMMEESIEGEDAMMDKEAVVVEITGENFAFSQDTITVKKGDLVRIEFESTDGFHDWVVDELDAATEQVDTGGTTSVEFVADQAGEFEYYCSVGQHRAQGMVGTLVVTE